VCQVGQCVPHHRPTPGRIEHGGLGEHRGAGRETVGPVRRRPRRTGRGLSGGFSRLSSRFRAARSAAEATTDLGRAQRPTLLAWVMVRLQQLRKRGPLVGILAHQCVSSSSSTVQPQPSISATADHRPPPAPCPRARTEAYGPPSGTIALQRKNPTDLEEPIR
jgi:hypothetical protein